MWTRRPKPVIAVAISLALFGALTGSAEAADAKALAQGFKDSDSCNTPYAQDLDAKAFLNCLNGLGAAFKGTPAAMQSYIAGLGFNAWSLANVVAASKDQDLMPEIKSRAKASKERKVAMQLFDVFRKAQKDQKIADGDLAKLVGAKAEDVKPVLDYYDALPKK
jgi:hypothetical protein